ncbi:ATP-binding protein [Dactylosporangium sp. NPDC049140]|uniref:ATP-binding protein n=1 Tax=Dactylosporangium sp. NPDC049140 TaxID=3155647 RepID=UPI0033DF3BF3
MTDDGVRPYRDSAEHLTDELRRLDVRIARRLARTAERHEAISPDQVARAVYITRAEVDWLLAGSSGGVPPEPADPAADLSAEIAHRVRASERAGVTLGLPALGRHFGLSPMELDAVVICLAPELRRAYDRLYAYLQDDITRQRPSVDLVLDLLCADERERWAARPVFAPDAPLLRSGLVHTWDDPQSPSGSSGLARMLSLDPQVTRFLLGSPGLDGRTSGYARLDRPGAPVPGTEVDPALTERVARLAGTHRPGGPATVLQLMGADAGDVDDLARRVSARLGRALLSLDVPAVPPAADPGALVALVLRDGRLFGAAVHLAGTDALSGEEQRPVAAALAAAVDQHGGLVFLSGAHDWPEGRRLLGGRVQVVAVPAPDPARSAAIWREELAAHTPRADAWATELAGRYRLPAGRIPAAVDLAVRSRTGPLGLPGLFTACRGQSAPTLGDLAVAVPVRAGWDDLVLPGDSVAQLHEISDQFRHRARVWQTWGFGGSSARGRGLSALFNGPPGTGKTMAAEVLAGDLGLDLFHIDLSGVVSKYIGETEKNLSRVFAEARSSNAILFFDEADALFGKRTEVSDAHDRYANIETSYLLQKMEEYDGVVLLATNLARHLDEAFTRRIRFHVEFPFPDANHRERIWRTLVPAAAPVSSTVDYAALAEWFPVAGGNIRNIAVSAAFLAAADGGVITEAHILRSGRREYEKMGKLWSPPGEPAQRGRN